jgi:hypothetical protein
LPQNSFNEILLEAVDESLSSLGDLPRQAVLFHLECSFKIKKERIPENITEFTRALEKIFGPGAPYLEKLIVKRLHEKLGSESEEAQSWNFLEYVHDVKENFSRAKERVTI